MVKMMYCSQLEVAHSLPPPKKSGYKMPRGPVSPLSVCKSSISRVVIYFRIRQKVHCLTTISRAISELFMSKQNMPLILDLQVKVIFAVMK